MTTNLTITRHDDPPDTMTIAFDPPVAFKGGQIDVLELREPTGRQVREAERQRTPEAPYAGMVAYELKLISLVAGLSEVAVDALPIGAVNYAAGFLQEFIEAGSGDEDDAEPAEEAPATEACSLPLDPPIKFTGVTYSELDLREPLGSEIRKARQLMRTPGSLFEARRSQIQLVTSVAGVPQPVIEALPIRVLNEAGRILGRFTVAGRPTGKR